LDNLVKDLNNNFKLLVDFDGASSFDESICSYTPSKDKKDYWLKIQDPAPLVLLFYFF